MKKLRLKAGVKIKAANGTQPKRRRFSILAYTGGPLLVNAYELPIYIDLSGLRVSSQRRPILYNHRSNRKNIVGQSDRIAINAPTDVTVEGFFLNSTEIAREVQKIAEDGFEWQASVGADPETIEEVRDGQTAEVNGRTATGPCLIARQSVLGEVSFVVQGADDKTSARIVARLMRAGRSVKGNSMTFEQWLASLGFDVAALSPDQLTKTRKQFAVLYPDVEAEGEDDELLGEGEEDELIAEGLDDDLLADGEEDESQAEGEDEELTAEDDEKPVASRRASARRKKLRAARLRAAKKTPVRKISAAAREMANEYTRIAAIQKVCKAKPKLLAQALKEGWTVDKARLEMLRASRATAPKPQRGPNGIKARAYEAAMLLATGVCADRVAKFYDQQTVNQAMEPALRGTSLHVIMDQVIEASGNYYSGSRKSDGFIRAALEADRTIKASGGFSTMSLSNILENVANKTLIAAYEAVETTWQTVCAVGSNNDFKVASRYRLDSQGAFRKVGPDGELKHIKLTDAKYTNQLDTLGAIIALTRQMQFNDDLDAFLDIPRIIGRLSALSIEEAFYILLLSNPGNFYHANNRNLATTGSALSIAGVTLLEQKFRDQVDTNGKPILMSPQIMLVPTSLKVEADNIHDEISLNESTSTDKGRPNRNPHKGKFKPVSSPYLNNEALRDENGKALTGQSAAAWYLFANPANRASFRVAFLNGVQTPTIQSAETDFSTLGMQWRGFHDFGVGTEDPVASAKATGAA